MVIELEIITDIVMPLKDGKLKIIKRNDIMKKLFNIFEVKIEEYVNPRNGKHIKKYSGLYDGDTYYKINKPFEELKKIVQNKSIPVVGFEAYRKGK